MNEFLSVTKKNVHKVACLLFIYEFALILIGMTNFPYIDDASRQIEGNTYFAAAYSRWGSEILSWIVQGNDHLTDLGIVTFILSGAALTFASLILVYVLNNKRIGWLSIISSSLLGLNPWFLGCVSFRFDGPYMSMSILSAIFPFLWWNKKGIFYPLSIICIFFMCNTYQLSSGIYIVFVLTLLFKEFLQKESILTLLKTAFLSALSFSVGILLFFFETKLNPEISKRGTPVEIASLTDLPMAFARNTHAYFATIYRQSSFHWKFLAVILIILFILTCMKKSKLSAIGTGISTVIYLGLASVLSYGVFLVFSASLAITNPRYAYGFAAFFTILLIYMTDYSKTNWLKRVTQFVSVLFLYYLLSFPLMYAAQLHFQYESFQNQSLQLSSDISPYINDKRKTIITNRLFKNSPILVNSEQNYPILQELVSNNEWIYWPNNYLFNTISGLDVTLTPDPHPENFSASGKEKVVSNYFYDIYTTDQELYIINK